MPSPDSTTLRIAGSVGIDDQTVADLTVPIGEGVSGRVYQFGSRIIVDSVSEADSDEDVYDSRLYNEPPALALPMRGSEQTVGVLHLAERVGHHEFTDWELEYLSLLSNCAASAIQSILTRRAREEAREAITVALASLADSNDAKNRIKTLSGAVDEWKIQASTLESRLTVALRESEERRIALDLSEASGISRLEAGEEELGSQLTESESSRLRLEEALSSSRSEVSQGSRHVEDLRTALRHRSPKGTKRNVRHAKP